MQRSKHNGLQKAASPPEKSSWDIAKVSLGFSTYEVQLVQERLRGKQSNDEGLLEWKDLREIPLIRVPDPR